VKVAFDRIVATPVVVPSRPDSIMSPDIVDDWSKSPGIAKTAGGSTATFPDLPKYMLRGEWRGRTVGIGETYRASDMNNLRRNAAALIGRDLATLQLSRLPFPLDREYDGFELLVFDALGKALDLPVHQLLGGRCRDRVECSMWTGRRTPADAGRKAWEGQQRGFDCIKFKCNDQDDVAAWCDEVQRRCGQGMRMIFDPNQRWGDLASAEPIMQKLRGFNIVCIEDPVRRDLYGDSRELRRRTGLPVAIHVSLPYCVHGQSITDTLTVLKEDACDGYNFNGAMAPFVRLADIAELAGKPCWHGSEVDLGVMEAGYVHAAAAAPACTWPSDIFGRLVREHDLLTQPLQFVGKHILVPTGPGLGVSICPDAQAKYRAGEDLVLAQA
jgi:muconate cycloisomerase